MFSNKLAVLILLFFCSCPFFSGCLPTTMDQHENIAVSNFELDNYVNVGKFMAASLSDLNGMDDIDLTQLETRKLISALKPISKVIPGNHLPKDRKKYCFRFQRGKNPVSLEIYLGEHELLFFSRNHTHYGGNASEFKNVVEECFAQRHLCVLPEAVCPPENGAQLCVPSIHTAENAE